jgi:hypothetical protein
MSKPFYQSTDAALASGSQNLVEVVTPTPALFGVVPSVLANYTTLTESFNDLFAISSAPATRTSAAIQNTQAAKWPLRAASAAIAATITGTPTVTDGQLVLLRLNPRVPRQSRNLPDGSPVVDIVSVKGRVVVARVHEPGSDRRGMPYGAPRANIYTYVGPNAPEDPREYHFEGATNRAKYTLLFPDSVPSGATIWIAASWVGGRGQVGFGGSPISFTLQGGAVAPAA